jgi:hypothetical protein
MTWTIIDCAIWVIAVISLSAGLRTLLEGKRWRIAAIFLGYLGTMGCFAHVYSYMYSLNTSWFAFASDIEKTRRQELAGGRTDIDRVNALQVAFEELSDQVFRGRAMINPSDQKEWLVRVSCAHYRFDFNFNPTWSNEGNQFVRHGRVVIKDMSGILLGSESVRLTGPTTSSLIGLSTRDRDKLFESIFPPRDPPSILALMPSITESLSSAHQIIESPELQLGPSLPEDWTFEDFLYFSVITQATVGYGDILPNSSAIRVCVIIQVMIGLVILGIGVTWVTVDES